MKYLYPSLLRKLLCLLFFAVPVMSATSQDLPGAPANLQTAPAGTYVIAMDNVNQAASTINTPTNSYLFNLKAYGLAVFLLDINYPLKWVIKSGKAKDAIDFSATAERVTPVYDPAAMRDFRSGPILIFPQDTAGLFSVIGVFNSQQPDSCKVKVYRLTQSASVDIRYYLTRPPKAALFNDSCDIHRNFMEMASVPTVNYKCVPNASTLRSQCYTIATDPHTMISDLETYDADSIYNFVMAGGNFLAECEGVQTFESLKMFQSATGVIADPSGGQYNNFNNNVYFDNPDMAYGQYQGGFRPWSRGAQKVWRYSSASTNNFYPVTSCKRNSADNLYYVATVSKMTADTGSLVFYLGNHEYFTHDCHTCTAGTTFNQEEVNGIRLYLNAVLIPSKFRNCVNVFDIPLAVQLTDFSAFKKSDETVELNWNARNEDENLWYIIEHSVNGRDFNVLDKRDGLGSGDEISVYSFLHNNPRPGINYYRLKIVSTAGKTTYSEIKKVAFDEKQFLLHVFPNPASGHVQLMADVKDGERFEIKIIDISGKLVDRNSTVIRNQKGDLDLEKINKGIYIVVATDGKGNQYKTKLVVQ